MYAVEYETFNVWAIVERDGWFCSICSDVIDPNLSHPDPLSKSLDHVIPLSRGGSHTRANAAVVHLICNIRKRDRMPDQEVQRPSAVAT